MNTRMHVHMQAGVLIILNMTGAIQLPRMPNHHIQICGMRLFAAGRPIVFSFVNGVQINHGNGQERWTSVENNRRYQ